jgi:acyl-CoA synthetase (NDP forming)
MGVGKFVHTGNEADLTSTDFLEYFGNDPEVQGILMYIEGIRDGRRFIEAARNVSRKKPVIMYKAGRTPNAAQAASSHTGALSGEEEIYDGILYQAGIIRAPTMELLLPLGHALLERPPLKGRRIAILTMGGSWGVLLCDALEKEGLYVNALSLKLQKALRSFGMPPRASTRNPVDIGASGDRIFGSPDSLMSIGRKVLSSGEVDALIFHGLSFPGMLNQSTPAQEKVRLETHKKVIGGFQALEKETGRPVLIGGAFTPLESQTVYDLNRQGIRFYNRLNEIAQLLALMHDHWRITQGAS